MGRLRLICGPGLGDAIRIQKRPILEVVTIVKSYRLIRKLESNACRAFLKNIGAFINRNVRLQRTT